MDKSAVGHDYIAPHFKHASQTDYSSGFGGKYGVQSDRIDKVWLLIFYLWSVFKITWLNSYHVYLKMVIFITLFNVYYLRVLSVGVIKKK